MASFVQYQEAARKRTRVLVLLYLLCLAAIILAIHAVAALVASNIELGDSFEEQLFSPELFLWVAGIVGAIVALATLSKTVELSAGGSKVATMLGGRRIFNNTRNAKERRLLNVVEEMSLASGVPIPAVFVLDDEPGINAFAAGWSPSDASVTVTAGALDNFNRDELQAVVGHEFSHILNGDMRLNIRLMSTIFGIICIAVIGQIGMRLGAELLRTPRRRSSKDKDPTPAIALGLILLGAAIWLIGSIGVFFGKILQATISRQREYLADASSVQFTRNPAAMAAALKVIGAVSAHGSISSPHASEISHMLFSAPSLDSLLSSHPPLLDRIRRYEPSFSGSYVDTQIALKRRALIENNNSESSTEEDDEDVIRRGGIFGHVLSGEAVAGVSGFTGSPSPARTAPALSKCAGAASPLSGVAKEEAIPFRSWVTHEELEAMHNPADAPAIIFGLVLDNSEGAARQAQIAAIDAVFPGGEISEAATAWAVRFADAPSDRIRRAACEIATSSIRTEPAPTRQAIAELLDNLVKADGVVTPLEFALAHKFKRLIGEYALGQATSSGFGIDVAARVILAHVAWFGNEDEQSRIAAYGAGLRSLPGIFRVRPEHFRVLPELSYSRFETALDTMRRQRPLLKQWLMKACETTVAADGVMTSNEENMLAAIADGIEAVGYNSLVNLK